MYNKLILIFICMTTTLHAYQQISSRQISAPSDDNIYAIQNDEWISISPVFNYEQYARVNSNNYYYGTNTYEGFAGFREMGSITTNDNIVTTNYVYYKFAKQDRVDDLENQLNNLDTFNKWIYFHGNESTDGSWRLGYNVVTSNMEVQVRADGLWSSSLKITE